MKNTNRVMISIVLVVFFVVSGGCATTGPVDPAIVQGLTLSYVEGAAYSGVFFLLREIEGTDFDRAHRIINHIGDALENDGKYDFEDAMALVIAEVPKEYQPMAVMVLQTIRVGVEVAVRNKDFELAHQYVLAALKGARTGINMIQESRAPRVAT